MRIVTPFNVETGQLTATNVVNEFGPWEPAATNLLSYPRQFDNTSWYKTRLLITPNSAVAPDGTLTAAKANWNGVNSNSERPDPYIGRTESCGAAAGGRTFAASVWLKALNVTDKTLEFNCIVGGVVFNTTLVINDDGKWHRYSSVFTVNDDNVSTTISYRFDIGDNTIIESDDYFIWHAQLEKGSFPTSVIPDGTTFTSRASTATFIDDTGTLQTAAIDVARDDAYGYVDGVLKPIGLLLEGAGTNLLEESGDLTENEWLKFDSEVTLSLNSSVTGGFYSRIEAGSTGSLTLLVNQIKPTATGENYTFSFFANKDYSLPFLQIDTIATNRSIFSLDSGSFVSVTSSVSKTLVEDRGGYYFISLTFLTNSDSTRVGVMPVPDSNIGYNKDYVAGDYAEITAAQFEEGSFPTSYIPTQGSQVTRAADVSSSPQVTRAADSCERMLGDEFNNEAFSYYYEFYFDKDKITGNPYSPDFALSTGDGRISLRFSGNGSTGVGLQVLRHDGSVNISTTGITALTDKSLNKVSASFTATQVIICINGTPSTFTLTGAFTNVDRLRLGDQGIAGRSNTIQKDFRLYPTVLSEAELITLTGGN